MILGALVAVAGLSSRRWLNRINRVYVELFRAIPLLVLEYLVLILFVSYMMRRMERRMATSP